MTIQLRIFYQDHENQVAINGDVVEFGRFGDAAAANQVDLSMDGSVSRMHARIVHNDGTYTIEDLGSSGGTMLNGRRIPPHTPRIFGMDDRIAFSKNTSVMLAPPYVDQGIIRDEVPASATLDSLIQTGILSRPDSAALIRNYLRAAQDISTRLSSTGSMDDLLQTAVQEIQRVIPNAHLCGLLMLDEAGHLPEMASYSWPLDAAEKHSRTLATEAINRQQAFVWQYEDPSASILKHGIESALYAPMMWENGCYGVVYVINTEARDAFDKEESQLLQIMAQQAAMFIKNQLLQDDLRREAVIRDRLLVHFSPQVMEELIAERQVRLGGSYKSLATVLVSDIRGFTAMSNDMAPGDVMDMLNEMFSLLAPQIHAYGGAIDKYIGDAILAVFGSPREDPEQGLHAVQAAVAMQQALHAAAPSMRERFGKAPVIGIGVHTGPLVHGFLGAEERLEYTVIGDTVNMASRLCDKVPAGEVYITAATHAEVRDTVPVDPQPMEIKSAKHPDTEPSQMVYKVQFTLG